MTGTPVAQTIPRRGRGTRPPEGQGSTDPADWDDVRQILHRGEAGPYWLSVGRDDGSPHVRPVFAAWAESSFFFASKGSAVKTHHLQSHTYATVTVDLDYLHLVVEGRVARVTAADRLQLASDTMQHVFLWPTRVAGDELDADYGAPTSGGPPYQVYELTPVRAYGFPTRDEVAPTRWVFDL
ncbi:pyridoxamine 5'-phosphate oxidase family protein [Actinoplanes solisilvae]|uniref:pyridoxamine 5'-phosphate oxidase family protein n=1 Tax=Actinoplanes solisilvae TaxID=2486853 RepID=UPI000FD819C5|nr:pyridoxamine 5'-phosphate oxidase family protein [Actinoplanes solisilvae]